LGGEEIRILVCSLVAAILIISSLASLSSNPLSILVLGVGVLVLIFGFVPSAVGAIIEAIVKIVTAPF